jgi:hypothetical protein
MNVNGNERTIYCGAFVHSITPQKLDICNKAAIGVDENGKIAFVHRDVKDYDNVKTVAGWEDAKVVRLEPSGFFFPGFIGEFDFSIAFLPFDLSKWLHTLSTHITNKHPSLRYPHPRLTIPQRRYLRQIHPPRLAQHLHLPSRKLLLRY